MNMQATLRGALRRIAGSSFPKLNWPLRRPPAALLAAGPESARRTVPLPSIFTPGAPTLVRAGVMPKPTPANLRRFAEMPIARKAINTIKDRIAGMQWRIQPRHGRSLDDLPDAAERIATLVLNFEQPNPEDSFRSFIEQILEDVLVGGFGAIELDLSGDPGHPLTLWPVDGASIRIRTDWDGNPSSPHYVQATAAFVPDQDISLADEELSYIRLNSRTYTPFGLGKLEVAFETIHEFLCAHRFASRLAATASCNTRSGCRTSLRNSTSASSAGGRTKSKAPAKSPSSRSKPSLKFCTSTAALTPTSACNGRNSSSV
jgi:hypothetical protein